jgi:cell division protein FtsB
LIFSLFFTTTTKNKVKKCQIFSFFLNSLVVVAYLAYLAYLACRLANTYKQRGFSSKGGANSSKGGANSSR